MLIRFLAGLAALLVPALLIIGAVVAWALIRRPVVRGVVIGLLMLVLCVNAVVVLASKLGQGSIDQTFAQACERYSKPQIVATRRDVKAVLADFDWSNYRKDPSALFAGEFYPSYLLERFFLGGASPYVAFGSRVGAFYDVKRASAAEPSQEKRLREWPDATVGYHWEKNDLSHSSAIFGFTLVVVDLESGERLATWPAFATRGTQVGLFFAPAVAPTVVQLGRTRRCPAVADLAAFVQSVAQP